MPQQLEFELRNLRKLYLAGSLSLEQFDVEVRRIAADPRASETGPAALLTKIRSVFDDVTGDRPLSLTSYEIRRRFEILEL